MEVEKSIEIARPCEEVFAFVSDPRNDVHWCPKVLSVTPLTPQAQGPGARFKVVHRPIPLRPAREMDHSLADWDPPHRLVWSENDGRDELTVTYSLEATATGTRLTQHDRIEKLAAPRPLHPMMRLGIAADVGRQLKLLRRHLESR